MQFRLLQAVVLAVLVASAVAADIPPSSDAIVAVFNKKPEKGGWAHRTITSTAVWSDRPTIIEEWERIAPDGTPFRRSETYYLDSQGAKVPGASISILNADGDWALVTAKKRAVRWPPPESSTAAPPPADVMYFTPGKWKTLGVEKTKIEGKACWALSSDVPPETRAYYAKRAEPFKKLAGVESVDRFIPEKHRLVVDAGCTAILAMEYVAAGGLVVVSERYRALDAPPTDATFAIPAGYEKVVAGTMDEYFKATE